MQKHMQHYPDPVICNGSSLVLVGKVFMVLTNKQVRRSFILSISLLFLLTDFATFANLHRLDHVLDNVTLGHFFLVLRYHPVRLIPSSVTQETDTMRDRP